MDLRQGEVWEFPGGLTRPMPTARFRGLGTLRGIGPADKPLQGSDPGVALAFLGASPLAYRILADITPVPSGIGDLADRAPYLVALIGVALGEGQELPHHLGRRAEGIAGVTQILGSPWLQVVEEAGALLELRR